MTTIGNIGIGLFILIILWILALCVFVYSVRAQSNIGWVVLIIATLITVILVVIPTETKEKPKEDYDILEKDYASIYRTILLSFLLLSVILACVFFFFLHCIEPLRAKPIKTF